MNSIIFSNDSLEWVEIAELIDACTVEASRLSTQ